MADKTLLPTPSLERKRVLDSPKSSMPERNGVRMPGLGTITGRVWEIADELLASLGKPPTTQELLAETERRKIDTNTAKTQLGHWRRYHDFSQRRAANRSPDGAASPEVGPGKTKESQPSVATGALPYFISESLKRLAAEWLTTAERPRPPVDVVEHWDELVSEWIEDPKCPLLVRKSTRGAGRGAELKHPSGRTLVCVDNSPAHWTYASAILGKKPTIAELLAALESGEWPVMFIGSKAEAASLPRYRGILARSENARALNEGQWKVCHIHPVGLRSKGSIDTFNLEELKDRCRRLLSPSNMFVVPKSHGGFGELPEVVEVFQHAVSEHRAACGKDE